MRYKLTVHDRIIRGSCPLFACRCCYTKYGRKHQAWCEAYRLTKPCCQDCLYRDERRQLCVHPAKKGKGDSLYEEDKRPLRKSGGA